MKRFEREFAANLEGWNLRTPVHLRSGFYEIEAFVAGKTSLRCIELEELGDVAGKRLLHLMCHFGQDTLSLARMGAQATGVDFSETAIAAARDLSRRIAVPAKFVCCNLYDTRRFVHGAFDVVYTSYGVVGWLPDLTAWAQIIADSLRPGGTFYIAEFHPFVWMLDEHYEKFTYGYFHTDTPLEFAMQGTYADRDAAIRYRDFNWVHSLGDVVSALVIGGLEIEFLHEFPFTVYDCFPNLEKIGERKWRFRHLKDTIPYLFSIRARKR